MYDEIQLAKKMEQGQYILDGMSPISNYIRGNIN